MPEIIINEILDVKEGTRKTGANAGEKWVKKLFNAVVKDDKGTRTQKLVGFDNFENGWTFEVGKKFEGWINPPKPPYKTPTFVVTSEIFDQDGDVIPPKPEPTTKEREATKVAQTYPLADRPNKEYVPSDTAEPGEIKKESSPPSSTTATAGNVIPVYKTPVSLHEWLYAIELAIRLYERDTTQNIEYKDIIDTANKFCQMP